MEEIKNEKPVEAKGVRLWVFIVSVFAAVILSSIATYTFISSNVQGSNEQPILGESENSSNETSTNFWQQDGQKVSGQYAELDEVYSYLKNDYIDSNVSSEQLIQGAIKGMAEAVEDPYTEYIPSDESSRIEDTLTGKFGGIGAELTTKNNQVVISATMEGTPSQKAGLQSGDVIYKVDGADMTGKTVSEVVSVVRGEVGTDVVLTILRGNQEIEVKITRAEISLTSVEGQLDANNPTIGYIQITSFSANTASELEDMVKNLRQQGATSFIFDVRYNPGGLLDQALIISNMFVEDGKVLMQTENRSGKVKEYTASDVNFGSFNITEPYVLLVNDQSASAAEILAAALKESANATVIGVKTYGKGTVQSVEEIGDGNQLKFTTAKWLTPNGTWIHGNGIEPTKVVTEPDYARLTLIDTRTVEKQGNVSENVKTIETILVALGQAIPADGYFDEATKKAVESFQASNGLPVNGEVDAVTADKLSEKIREHIKATDTQYKAAIEELKK